MGIFSDLSNRYWVTLTTSLINLLLHTMTPRDTRYMDLLHEIFPIHEPNIHYTYVYAIGISSDVTISSRIVSVLIFLPSMRDFFT